MAKNRELEWMVDLSDRWNQSKKLVNAHRNKQKTSLDWKFNQYMPLY